MRKNQAKKQANRISIQTATPKTICNNRPTQKPLFQQQPRQPECGSTDKVVGRAKRGGKGHVLVVVVCMCVVEEKLDLQPKFAKREQE